MSGDGRYINLPADVEEQAKADAKARGAELAYAVDGEDLKELAAIEAAAPAMDDLIARFGAENYDVEKGVLHVDLKTAKDRADWNDAITPQLDLEIARGGKTNTVIDDGRVNIRNKHGALVRVCPENERVVCTILGAKPVSRISTRQGLRSIEGILHRPVGPHRWQSLAKCSLGTPIAPCGNPRCETCCPAPAEAAS